MIGKYQLQHGANEFITGMASSDYTNDGMLGTSCTGLNPFVTPGVLYGLANGTDVSTNVAGNLIASCEDSNASSPLNRYFIDDKSASAGYYSFNGTSFTKQATGSATFVSGKSDLTSFAGQFYATTATDIVQWNGTSTIDEDYGTVELGITVDGSAHHPLLLYQGFMWYGNGNLLGNLANDNTTYATALTLPSKEKIVALGIDPGTGLMMISVQTVYDISDTTPSLKIVYLYDGISSKPTRKILVDDLVTAFYNLEGQVYCGSGQTIGVWNGSGITFLRKLKNVSLDNRDLLYKHHFTNIRNILLIVDGTAILAYGAVVSGQRKFFYTANGTTKFSIVAPVGSNRFIVAQGTTLYTTPFIVTRYDLSSTSAGIPSIEYNNIYFPRPVFIRRVRVITTGITTTSGGGIGNVTLFDEKGNSYTTQVLTFVVTAAQSPRYVFDFDYTNVKLQGLQPRFNLDTQGFGIIRTIIYYDIAE